MNNKEIGKLIATLRKQKNMTQQDLGDKLGVGFRAVSKWERGINFPDIGLINDLCEILGITTDELFKGKLNSENKTKKPKKLSLSIKISLSIIGVLLIVISSIVAIIINIPHVYEMKNTSDADYYINGKVTFHGKQFTLIINKIGFINDDLSSKKIKNYEYEIKCKNKYLFRYGYHAEGDFLEEKTTVQNAMEMLRINYTNKTSLTRKEILEHNIILIINFIDEDNQKITKEIPIILYPINKK